MLQITLSGKVDPDDLGHAPQDARGGGMRRPCGHGSSVAAPLRQDPKK